MKIGTINIDWFKKPKYTKQLIIDKINEQDFDFLIVTENLEDFVFSKDYFIYHSDKIPLEKEFQTFDYGAYLKGKQAIRTSIYSKYASVEKNYVTDSFTSVSHTFSVDEKPITIYGTIIGTLGVQHQRDIAKKELLNFISDIESLSSNDTRLVIVGDFNTSFFEDEKRELSQINSRSTLVAATDKFCIRRTTEDIVQNIDHIFLSKQLKAHDINAFISESDLKDRYHKGISVILE